MPVRLNVYGSSKKPIPNPGTIIASANFEKNVSLSNTAPPVKFASSIIKMQINKSTKYVMVYGLTIFVRKDFIGLYYLFLFFIAWIIPQTGSDQTNELKTVVLNTSCTKEIMG